MSSAGSFDNSCFKCVLICGGVGLPRPNIVQQNGSRPSTYCTENEFLSSSYSHSSRIFRVNVFARNNLQHRNIHTRLNDPLVASGGIGFQNKFLRLSTGSPDPFQVQDPLGYPYPYPGLTLHPNRCLNDCLDGCRYRPLHFRRRLRCVRSGHHLNDSVFLHRHKRTRPTKIHKTRRDNSVECNSCHHL